MLCCALTVVTPMQARDAMLAGRARRAQHRHLGLPAESVLPQAQDTAVLDDFQVLPCTSTSVQSCHMCCTKAFYRACSFPFIPA